MSRGQSRSIIRWWLDGLRYLVPRRFTHSHRRHANLVRLNVLSDRIEAKPASAPISSEPEIFARPSPDDYEQLRKFLQRATLAKHRVEIVLAGSLGLRRHIRLPKNALTDLRSLIAHDIDRQTPFKEEEVTFAYRMRDDDPGIDSVGVELVVVPNNTMHEVAALMKVLPLPVVRIELANANDSEPQVNLLRDDHATSTPWYVEQVVDRLLIGLIILLLIANAGLPFYQLHREEAKLQSALVSVKAAALESAKIRGTLQDENERSQQSAMFRQSRARMVVILNELTRVLPDDTWLRRVQINGATMKIQGESTDAAQLIEKLQGSPRLTAPRFQSQITQNAATRGEQFSIKVTISSENNP